MYSLRILVSFVKKFTPLLMKKSIYKHLFVSIILFIGIAQFAQAQVGKTFWFVAPEVTNDHTDDEAVLRITALDQAAKVTISLPANPNFTPIVINVSANQQEKIELRNFLSLIENGTMGNSPQSAVNDWQGWTQGTAFKKGMLIESTEDITAYYEIANATNPDRFTLKGNNALGTEFYIPSQNAYENYPLSPPAREQVDIVATEDNTIITFTLTDDVNFHNGLTGHSKGVEYTITLNRGETYCLRRTDGSASRNLGGSHITSTKPIAITISDDSIRHPNIVSYDLVGDQLVPINVIGREYIVVNTMHEVTWRPNTGQKAFIVATKDNTVVTVDGVALTPTLQAGEMTSFDIKDFHYIESNHDIYVYQFSSVEYELGSALVPSINCTGSKSVSISRIYNDMFAVQIMTQKKNISSFKMTPNNLLNNLTWNWIKGSGSKDDDDTWYAAVVSMNPSTNTVYTITNSGLFHLSVLDANGSSMSYGYFSSFNNLRIEGPTMACLGDEVVLTTKQDPSNLTWYYDDGENGEKLLATGESSITAQKEGEYWVVQDFEGCFATDRIDVKFNTPRFTLGGDTTLCYDKDNPDITLTAITTPPGEKYTYQWGAPFETNTTNTLSFTPNPGETYEFSLTATTIDDLKCTFRDTAEIVVKSIPVVTWNLPSGQEEICLGEIIALEDIQDDFTYQWYLDGVELVGATDPFYQPTVSGLYEVAITTIEECTVVEARPITVRPNPTVTLADAAECPGDPHTFSLSGYSSYEWYDALYPATILGTNPTITLNQPISELVVKVSNTAGCFATDTAEFKWHNQHVFTFGKDTSLCEGMDMSIEIDAHFIDYKWKFNNVDISTTGSNPTANDHLLEFSAVDYTVSGIYSITAQDNINGCPVSGNFNLTVLDPVSFTLEYVEKNGKICEGDSIKLIPGNDNDRPFTTFNWSQKNGANWDPIAPPEGGKDHLIVMEAGEFMLEAIQDNNCSAVSSPLSVDVIESPDFRLANASACPDEDLVLVVDRYVNVSGDPEGEFSRIVWRNFSGEPDITTNETPPTSKVVDEGNHVVIVYDNLGCFTAKEATAEYYLTPDITIEDASFCDGEGYDLTISSDPLIKSYSWSKDGVTLTTNRTYEGGEYILTVVTQDDCEVVDTIQLTAWPSPTPTLPPQTEICEGESINIETERSHRSYQWYFERVEIAGETSASLNPNSDGEYNLVVQSKNGCETLISTQVTINSNPTVDLGPDQIVCPGKTATINISGDYDRIVWSSGEQDVYTVKLNEGLHTVRVENNGCIGTDQVRVSWYPIPLFSLGEDEIVCPTELPRFIEVPTGFEEYIWHSEDLKKYGDSIQANIMDTVNILKVRDANGCWAMDTKIINLHPEPEYNFGGDIDECDTEIELIAGDHFSVENSTGIETTPVTTYYWKHNDANTPNILVNESGQYVVRASDGCWFKTDTFNVRVHPNPVITGLDTMVYARVTVLTDPDIGTQPFTYTLNNGNPQDNKTFNKVQNGEHTVWVEDIHGCTDFRVFQFNSNLDDLEIPNFFTPNGDGVNDRWIIKGLEKVPESDVRIYDRYGKLLIRYTASEIEGWDGTYLNAPVPSDDYWYVIHLKPIDKIVKGNVTIKR